MTMTGMWKKAFKIDTLAIGNAILSVSYTPGDAMPGLGKKCRLILSLNEFKLICVSMLWSLLDSNYPFLAYYHIGPQVGSAMALLDIFQSVKT